MRTRNAQLSLTLVCLVFGALLMMQFRTQGKIAKAQLAESSTDQATIISNLYDANLELRREVAKLDEQQLEYARLADQGELADMATDVNKLRVFTGLSEAAGPGISLKVAAQVRPEYIQDLINELRNAGAEAIAINGERIVLNSAVSTYRGKIVINGSLVESPFVFEAIGQSETLDRALGRKGGMVSYLQNTYPGTEIVLSKQESLTLPAFVAKAVRRSNLPTQ